MPIYEYKCEECGTVSEFIVFSDNEPLHCKSCKSADLTKLMSAHNTTSTAPQPTAMPAGGCCGSPGACGTPGACCGG